MSLNVALRSQNKGRGVPGTHFKRPGSKERMVGGNGEINASTKSDLASQISMLIEAHNSGAIDDTTEVKASIQESREVLAAAYHDKSGSRWAELGAELAGTLNESADRDGFMRRILKEEPVAQGNVPRVRVRRKRTSAIVAAGSGNVYPQIARDDYYYPPEFDISANVRVEKKEIFQGTGDILSDKYLECLEQVQKNEDVTLTTMLKKTVGITHPLQTLVGGLSVFNFTYMRSLITAYNIPVTTCLMASDYWNDIIASPSCGSYFDQVTKYELLQTGYLGNLLGVDFITDSFRHPNLKVLSQGELYMLADPINLGCYTSRGPVESQEVNEATLGSNSRGWYLVETLSMLTFNPRAVVRAQKG